MMQPSFPRRLSRNPIRVGCIAVSLLLVSLPGISNAQRVDVQPVEITGVITEINPNQITIRADGKLYAADISEVRSLPGGGILDIVPPEFDIKGQRSTDSLTKGMFVSFEAEVERYKMVKEPVMRLTVFSRTPFTDFGFLKPPAPALDDPEFAKKLEAADEEKNNNRKGPQRFLVAGILEKLSGTKMTMLVPHEGDQRKVTVAVSPETIVDFKMNSLNFASIGNRISAKGVSIVPQHFYATEVTVFIDPDKKLVKLHQKLREQAVAEGRDPDEVDRMIAGDPFKEIAGEEVAKLAANMEKDGMPKEDAKKMAGDEKAAKDGGKAGPDKLADDKKQDAPKPFAPAMIDDVDAKNANGRRKRGLTGKTIKIN